MARLRSLALIVVGALVVASCAGDDSAIESTSESSITATSITAPTEASIATPATIEVPAEVGGLEGVATDPATQRVFIGDLTNGDIWVGGLDDTAFELFAPAIDSGRPSALGLAVDGDGSLLYVATGAGGTIDVVDLADGSLVRTIAVPTTTGSTVNDVTVAPDGTLYASDSGAPRIYRSEDGEVAEVWLDYAGSDLLDAENAGLFLNGIVADDAVVLAADTMSGRLARVDRATAELSLVDLGGETAGRDGLALCGRTLYGVDIPAFSEAAAPEIVVTELNEDGTAGATGEPLTDPSLSFPATVAPLAGTLVVTNAQFGVQPPVVPFTLTVLAAPCPDGS